MFICAVTGKVSEPREKMIKVVVETRPRTYLNWNADGDEVVSHGSEIVREIGVTKEGFDQLVKQEVSKFSKPGNGAV
jgi:hypothetical protein